MINFVQSPSPGMEKRRGWVSREGESFICTLRGRKGHQPEFVPPSALSCRHFSKVDIFPRDGVTGRLSCSFSSLVKQTMLFLCCKIFFFPFTEEKVIFFMWF